MPDYAYLAKDSAGSEVSGTLMGNDLEHVVDSLHRRGLVVLDVAEKSSGWAGWEAAKKWATQPVGASGIPTRDLALFTRQLSTLFEAGIPLVRGLRGLSADETNRRLSKVVAMVSETVEQGSNLADAMAQHPRVFNHMYVSMIRAGENAGTLDEILDELAIYLEKMDAIKTKVRSAMSYPMFTLFFAIGVTLFLLFKIVPTFEEIYAGLGAQLPYMTRVVVGISRAIRENALISFAVVFGVMAIYIIWMRTPSGRYARDLFMIRMPIFGPIIRKAVVSRLTRTLGILMRSGLPVLDALDLVKGATGNEVLARAIDQAKGQVAKGEEITVAFRATGKLPEMTLQMMATGEESGQLDAMLIKTSDFYDRQVEAAVQGITALIEPLLIVLVGVIVGIVVVTMFLPIFYLGDAIMKGAY